MVLSLIEHEIYEVWTFFMMFKFSLDMLLFAYVLHLTTKSKNVILLFRLFTLSITLFETTELKQIFFELIKNIIVLFQLVYITNSR